mgnify:CR=1 FL=1
MKVGDLVEIVGPDKSVGIIKQVFTRREICGPNGDFFTERYYNVLVDGKTYRMNLLRLRLISSCDIS